MLIYPENSHPKKGLINNTLYILDLVFLCRGVWLALEDKLFTPLQLIHVEDPGRILFPRFARYLVRDIVTESSFSWLQVPWLASGAQGDVLFSVARITDQGDGRPKGRIIVTKDWTQTPALLHI